MTEERVWMAFALVGVMFVIYTATHQPQRPLRLECRRVGDRAMFETFEQREAWVCTSNGWITAPSWATP